MAFFFVSGGGGQTRRRWSRRSSRDSAPEARWPTAAGCAGDVGWPRPGRQSFLRPKARRREPGSHGGRSFGVGPRWSRWRNTRSGPVIEAGQGTPSFETSAEGTQRSAQLGHQFGHGHHLVASPALEERGGRIVDRFHGGRGVFVVGIVYDSSFKRHMLCNADLHHDKGKANDFAETRSQTSPQARFPRTYTEPLLLQPHPNPLSESSLRHRQIPNRISRS